MISFCVDSRHVVHAEGCDQLSLWGDDYRSNAQTVEEMAAWLSRPDTKDRHNGNPMLVGCPHCIGRY